MKETLLNAAKSTSAKLQEVWRKETWHRFFPFISANSFLIFDKSCLLSG